MIDDEFSPKQEAVRRVIQRLLDDERYSVDDVEDLLRTLDRYEQWNDELEEAQGTKRSMPLGYFLRVDDVTGIRGAVGFNPLGGGGTPDADERT